MTAARPGLDEPSYNLPLGYETLTLEIQKALRISSTDVEIQHLTVKSTCQYSAGYISERMGSNSQSMESIERNK